MAERNKDKKSYIPPEITRVVLRSEQAILSPCSASFTSAFSGGGGDCMANDCKNLFPAGGGDSAGTS